MFSDRAGQALTAATARRQTKETFRQAQPRACRAQSDIGAEGDLEPAAERVPADGGDYRLRQSFQLVEDPATLKLIGSEGRGPTAAVFDDIGASDKRPLASSSKDHYPYSRVGGDRVEMGIEGVDHRGRKHIQLVWPIEDETYDAWLNVLPQDRSHAHGHPFTAPAVRPATN
jgi:hypothetical protein